MFMLPRSNDQAVRQFGPSRSAKRPGAIGTGMACVAQKPYSPLATFDFPLGKSGVEAFQVYPARCLSLISPLTAIIDRSCGRRRLASRRMFHAGAAHGIAPFATPPIV